MSRATISTCGFPACRREPKLRDFSRRRTRAAAIVASAGLVAAGLLVSSPTTANPGVSAPEEAPSADRPQGGHEPKHPLKIKEKRDAQKAAALQRTARGQEARSQGQAARAKRCRSSSRAPTGSSWCSPSSATSATRPPRTSASSTRPTTASTCPAPQPQTFDGPLHNQIPQPDRATDNTTIWQENFSQSHYEDMYFNRMKEYLRDPVLGPLLRRGRRHRVGEGPLQPGALRSRLLRHPAGSAVTTCASTKALVRDALAIWVTPARSGKTMTQITGLPEDVRRPGPLRHRRRRRLPRARRLHRPLPDRPRRWRRGGR